MFFLNRFFKIFQKKCYFLRKFAVFPVKKRLKIRGKVMPRQTWTVHIYLFMALLFNNAITGLIDKEFRKSSSVSCLEKS